MSTWIATLIIFSKENTLWCVFFKDWIWRRTISSVSMMWCMLTLVVQQQHWKTSGLHEVKDWQLSAVVDCHPFGNWYLQRNKACILANGYETCCPGALRLLNLWLQPNFWRGLWFKGILSSHLCPWSLNAQLLHLVAVPCQIFPWLYSLPLVPCSSSWSIRLVASLPGLA